MGGLSALRIAFIVPFVSGCAAYTPVDVAKPSDITLAQATQQIAESLVSMKRTLQRDHQNFGLLIDQVDVDLNVTASAGQNASQDLKIDAAKTALAGIGMSADISGTQTSSAQRTNTIHMTFKNKNTANLNCVPFTNPKNINIPNDSTFVGAAPTPPTAPATPAQGGAAQKPAATSSSSGGVPSYATCNVITVSKN